MNAPRQSDVRTGGPLLVHFDARVHQGVEDITSICVAYDLDEQTAVTMELDPAIGDLVTRVRCGGIFLVYGDGRIEV